MRNETFNKNGYLSQTLMNVTIGQKSERQWVGEDIIEMKNEGMVPYNYSVVSCSQCDTFRIHMDDINLLPIKFRSDLVQLAKLRQS